MRHEWGEVGYRVNAKRGTQFRIWATGVLREHIIQGREPRLLELNRAVKLIAYTGKRRDLSGDEAKVLLAVVSDYRRALGLLDDYDHCITTIQESTAAAPIRKTVVPFVWSGMIDPVRYFQLSHRVDPLTLGLSALRRMRLWRI